MDFLPTPVHSQSRVPGPAVLCGFHSLCLLVTGPALAPQLAHPLYVLLPLLENFLLPHLYPSFLCLADCYLVPRLTFLGSLRDFPHFGLGDLISVHPLFPQSWAMVTML